MPGLTQLQYLSTGQEDPRIAVNSICLWNVFAGDVCNTGQMTGTAAESAQGSLLGAILVIHIYLHCFQHLHPCEYLAPTLLYICCLPGKVVPVLRVACKAQCGASCTR